MKTKQVLEAKVKTEGFRDLQAFKDFYDIASGFADVDIPLTQCFELALGDSIEDEDDRWEKASRLSDIVTNFYWHF